MLLEGDTLKLAEPRTKATLLVQPVSKMRVWGVGKEDQRYVKSIFSIYFVKFSIKNVAVYKRMCQFESLPNFGTAAINLG